jgi:hypothetical protein
MLRQNLSVTVVTCVMAALVCLSSPLLTQAYAAGPEDQLAGSVKIALSKSFNTDWSGLENFLASVGPASTDKLAELFAGWRLLHAAGYGDVWRSESDGDCKRRTIVCDEPVLRGKDAPMGRRLCWAR